MLGLWPLRIDQNGRLVKIKAPGIAKTPLNLWEEGPLPYPEPQWKWGLREGGMGRRKFQGLPLPLPPSACLVKGMVSTVHGSGPI